MSEQEEIPEQWVFARSTVHLPGFTLGTYGWVDTSYDYVRTCLDLGHLVAVASADDDESG